MFSYIYFTLSLLFFLISMLSVVKAPINFLWKLSIAVIEWGQYFALIVLVLIVFNIKAGGFNWILCLLNIASVVMFLLSAIRAYFNKGMYEENISKAFPLKKKPVRNYSLSWKDLFTGISHQKQIPMEYVFDEKNNLKLNFYTSSKDNAPCVIVIHGGAWSSGDNKQLPKLNSYLSNKGYAVAAISYRLAPQHTYLMQLSDVQNAIQWVKQNAPQLNIDRTHLVLLGRSAGAQLAQQAAYTNIDKDIKGVISFYCPADLVWGYSAPGNPLILDSRKVLDEFIGASAFQREDLYIAASPVYHVTSDSPPTLLLHGKPDVMVAWEHSQRMKEKLTNAGVKNLFVDIPWATHGYDYAFNGPSSQISIYAIEHFLAHICEDGVS